jgi:hypothetical protein
VWVILVDNNIPGTVGEEHEFYTLQRLNSVPSHMLEIWTTRPHWPPAHSSAHEPILVCRMPGVVENLKSVNNEMTDETDFNLVNLL